MVDVRRTSGWKDEKFMYQVDYGLNDMLLVAPERETQTILIASRKYANFLLFIYDMI